MPGDNLLMRIFLAAALDWKPRFSCRYFTHSKLPFCLPEKFTIFYKINAYHNTGKISRKKFFYLRILIFATDEHG